MYKVRPQARSFDWGPLPPSELGRHNVFHMINGPGLHFFILQAIKKKILTGRKARERGYKETVFIVSISGTVDSFQLGETFTGCRALTIVSSLMSG